MRISLKKEISEICLVLLLRSIAAATGGRRRPLPHVLEKSKWGTLGLLLLRVAVAAP